MPAADVKGKVGGTHGFAEQEKVVEAKQVPAPPTGVIVIATTAPGLKPITA